MNKQVPILDVIGVSHYFVNEKGVFHTLKNIDLTIQPNEFVTFVGPSGCGKTTLLNIIAGFYKATDGELAFQHENKQTLRRQIGFMQQQDFLFPWCSILDNVLIGIDIRGKRSKADIELAKQLLEELGLNAISDKFPHQLSGGMRQRVALARSLITDPHLLLLDEPFSALDMHIKIQLEQLVRSIFKKRNNAAILVTHDIGEAVAISDTIYIFDSSPGKIIKKIVIEAELASLDPYESRKHRLYNHYFDEIWTLLNGSDASEVKK